MEVWGNNFFESDAACELSFNFYTRLLYDSVGRGILFNYYRHLNMQSTESKKAVASLDHIEGEIEKIKKSEENELLCGQKIKDVLNTHISYYNSLGYHLSNCVEGKWGVGNQSTYDSTPFNPLTLSEAQTLQEIAAQSVFSPDDLPFFQNKQLSTKGIEIEKGVYCLAHTSSLYEAFYFMGFAVLNLETRDTHNLLTPYVFQNFLDSTSYFLQNDVLNYWNDSQQREESLVKEISRVLDKTLGNNSENSALFVQHYDQIQRNEQNKREFKVYEAHFMPYTQKYKIESQLAEPLASHQRKNYKI